MSSRAPATRPLGAIAVAALLLSSGHWPLLAAAAAEAAPGSEGIPVAGSFAAPASAAAPFETLIARVLVNTVSRGDLTLLRDARGNFFVAESDFASLGLSIARPAPTLIDGQAYVALSEVPGLEARFDPAAVTLSLQAAASALPGTTIDVGPRRSPRVVYPTDTSMFLNYGLNATGDQSFGDRRYQAATEFGARYGSWLFYGASDYQWGEGASSGYTRLVTNAQYDDRLNLRRLTLGDYFTPTFDLSSSVPMGGVSLGKDYSMNPYYVQYPTAGLRAELAFPSTVQVKVNGNVIEQRQVPPGRLDIANITTGVTGAQNVAVVIRDPFGREQVLQQPFFFATNAGLAEGLHEYSYNVGALRENYGLKSNDYGGLAAAAYHRYAFTNRLTLGLRGQAAQDVYNIGPFGTYQFPRFGVVAGGVSVGGSGNGGGTGYAASAAYSYTGGNFSVSAGARYFSPEFPQLADLTTGYRQRSTEYASASLYSPATGTATVTYGAFDSYDGPQTRNVNLSYTLSVLGARGLVAVNYLRTLRPSDSYLALLSLRYYFDRMNSVVAALGAARGSNTQSLSLQRTIPQGEGLGYDLTAGRASSHDSDGAFGRAFVQFNAAHAEIGAEYERSSRNGSRPGMANVFVAGSVGAVGGSVFAARPVQDSFALIRIPELADVPVYANGWYAGRTNAAGEVVASNINAYYDNFIAFGTKDLPLDYVFSGADSVISPSTRSGTLVTFEVRRMQAVIGTLVAKINGTAVPLEFRELTLKRGQRAIKGFTARRGEFYVEGVEPGEYLLQLNDGAPCTARLRVPDDAGAMTDVGALTCIPAAR
jgi:outer membrane usher protein FimD/PapC